MDPPHGFGVWMLCILSGWPGGPPGRLLNGDAWVQIAPVYKASGVCPSVRPGIDVTFHLYQFYDGHNSDKYKTLIPYDKPNLAASGFNPNYPTVYFAHGYLGGPDSIESKTMRKAYAARGDFNFISVGWRMLAGGPFYQAAVENVAAVGYQLARMLDFMEKNAGPLHKLHLIGNNLGAHVMGVAASQTRVVRVPRITGFDPAMANISTFALEDRLDPGDAYFVDVIDTDSPSEKRPHDFGHANFFIGRPRPAKCHVPRILKSPKNFYSKAFCGHGRAFELFATSVLHENAFPAMRCVTQQAFRSGYCRDPAEAVAVGLKAPNSARGSYFLFNEKELFGHGNALAAQQTSNKIGQIQALSPAASSPTNRYSSRNNNAAFKIFVP